MAKFNPSALSGDIRGKVGSTVWSRNKGGAYTRFKVTPNNPRTVAQSLVRQNFSQLSKNWSGVLTDAQRDAWNAFAAANPVRDVFGNSIILTGLSTYVRMNQVLRQIGQPIITDPPTDYSVETLPNPGAITITTVSAAYAINMHMDAGSPTMNTNFYVFATPPLAPGKTPNNNLFRYIGNPSGEFDSGDTIDLTAMYEAVFGAPIEGKKSWFDVGQVNIATGALLTGVKYDATAPAL